MSVFTYQKLPEFAAYPIEPTDITYKDGYEYLGRGLPFTGIQMARYYPDDKKYISCLKADENKAWPDTLACKLLADKSLPIGRKSVIVVNKDDGSSRPAILYSFAMYDPEHPYFKPTVTQPVDYAINLQTDAQLELLFAWDDFVFPVYHDFKTKGSFAASAGDIMSDLLDELSFMPNDFLNQLTEENPFVYPCTEQDDGFNGYGFFAVNRFGQETEIELSDQEIKELRRHLVSIRLTKADTHIMKDGE